jgi:sec-independent protein translocase protein TatB
MFGLSFWEITLILVVALLFLGPKRLPGLAKSVGKGLRELRRASSDLRSAIEEPLEEVRKPLEELRGDLTDAVHGFEQEVEREAAEEEPGDDPYARERAAQELLDRGEAEEADTTLEVEDRRREVEEMYAGFHAQEPQEQEVVPPPVAQPSAPITQEPVTREVPPPPVAEQAPPPPVAQPSPPVAQPSPPPVAQPSQPDPDDLFDDDGFDEEATAIGAPPEELIKETAGEAHPDTGEAKLPSVRPWPPKKPS